MVKGFHIQRKIKLLILNIRMFIEFLVNNLIKLYSKNPESYVLNNSDVIITEFDDLKKIDISKIKRVLFFQAHVLNEKDLEELE
jgi:hypothetical protein